MEYKTRTKARKFWERLADRLQGCLFAGDRTAKTVQYQKGNSKSGGNKCPLNRHICHSSLNHNWRKENYTQVSRKMQKSEPFPQKTDLAQKVQSSLVPVREAG